MAIAHKSLRLEIINYFLMCGDMGCFFLQEAGRLKPNQIHAVCLILTKYLAEYSFHLWFGQGLCWVGVC